MIDLLVTAGTVITVDAERRVIADGAVAIDGGRLVAVGPAAAVGTEARQHIDLPHGVALPGLASHPNYFLSTSGKNALMTALLSSWP